MTGLYRIMQKSSPTSNQTWEINLMKNHKTNQNQNTWKRSTEYTKLLLQFRDKTMDNFSISYK